MFILMKSVSFRQACIIEIFFKKIFLLMIKIRFLNRQINYSSTNILIGIPKSKKIIYFLNINILYA